MLSPAPLDRFMLAENPTDPTGPQYIVHTQMPLAFFLVLNLDHNEPVIDDRRPAKHYSYMRAGKQEDYQLIYMPFFPEKTIKVIFSSGDVLEEVREDAWEWWCDYLRWEDKTEYQ